MSRLGPWRPATPEERLDRLESLAEIQQLPVRYALALDSRDMDMLVSLFTPDVRVGREERGRDALRACCDTAAREATSTAAWSRADSRRDSQ